MKNIFNGKRFTMVVKKDARDLFDQYFKLIIILTCTSLAFFLLFAFFGKNFTDYEKTRSGINGIFVCVATLLAPFQLYKRFNHKIYGVNYFMLPASQAEKWLSMFFHCVIATPIVVILSITLIDLCLYPFYPWAEKSLWITSFDSGINFSRTTLGGFMTFFIVQSFCFLGNIWFQRAKIQKTVVAIVILLVAHAIFMLILWKLFGAINYATGPSTSLTIEDMMGFSKIWGIISMTIIYLVAPVGLWIVSFIKMKEQQL